MAGKERVGGGARPFVLAKDAEKFASDPQGQGRACPTVAGIRKGTVAPPDGESRVWGEGGVAAPFKASALK